MNMQRILPFSLFFLFTLINFSLNAQWLEFNDVTAQWSPMGQDGLEKDIAIGDLNQDGLEDIVVVRKNPFSNPGAGADLLLMNTGNKLEDQTAIYAPEFISRPSDSRDVFIGDFDNDNWPDVVIANTFEDQPVFYHNLGNDANGNWLGLADESSARFPTVLPNDVLQFCALWAGDVTGNGAMDIYFSNYNPNGGSNDVLLINDGNGVFTDETISRMGDLRRSAFGTSAEIVDMDNDGDQDIVKISTLYDIAPWFDRGVFILFNNGDGTFTDWMTVPSEAPYMFTVGDFNEDGLKDVYVVDDNSDYINMATAITPNTSISFQPNIIPDPRANFFGGNVKLADLDNNGYLDIGLADVDVDIPPCESGAGSPRKFTLMQNTMGTISAPYGTNYYPWNESTYDFAFIDLNQDGLPDLFLGRCNGYEIFLNSATADDCTTTIDGLTEICEGASTTLSANGNMGTYHWSTGATTQDISISEPGTYCVTITDADGCVDASCIQVEEGMISETNLEVSICEGEFFELGGVPYSATGDYQVTLTNAAGCDSIISLTLTVIPASITDNVVQICEGEVLMIGDSTYTESGDYLNLLLSSDGCDSLILTNLTVNPSYAIDITEVICDGETVEIGGQLFNATGIYEIVLQTQLGCDSTIFLDLLVLENSATQLNAQICAGSTYEAGGMSFDESGDYTITLTNTLGCDSLISLSLLVEDQFETNIDASICDGDVYMIEGQSFDESGEYTIELTASTGCDSILNLNLMVIEIPESALDVLICEGESIDVGGTTYNEAGNYEIILTSVEGCDSIINLSISTLPIAITQLDAAICEGEVFSVADMDFDTTGDYEVILVDQNGCDSLIFLSLVVNEPTESALDLVLCEGETATVGGAVFDEAGMYEVNTIAENGCDSTIFLNLNFVDATAILKDTLCFNDNFNIDGVVFDQNNPSGEVVLEGASVTGCDSIVRVDLRFTPEIILIESTIIDISDVPGEIILDITGGVEPLSFEWSNGATTQNIMSPFPGFYNVIVTDAAGCSASYTFFLPIFVSVVNDPLLNFELKAFPNPSPDLVQFELVNPPSQQFNLVIYDVLGRVVQQSTLSGQKFELKLPEASGTYFYQIDFGEGAVFSGRLVKQE